MVLQVDFADNYTAAYQDRSSKHTGIRSRSQCFPQSCDLMVSDSLEHDKRSVATFLSKIMEDIEMKHPAMKEIHIFSAGATSQFKNKFIWCLSQLHSRSCFQL